MRILSAYLMVLLFIVAGCGGTKELMLQLNLQEKENFSYTHTTIQDITVTTMGMEQDQFQKNSMDYKYEVLKVLPNGDIDLRVTITDVYVESKSMMENMKYDSKEGPAEDEGAKIYESMVGQSFRMTMAKDGKVKEVSGADKMLDDMFDVMDMPEEEGVEDMMATLKETLKNQFGDQAMAESMGEMTGHLPGKPIKVGESWERVVEKSSNIGMKITNTYTLIKREGGMAYIDVKSVMEPLPDADPLDLGVMQIKYNIGGTQEGQIIIDEVSGWTVNSDVDQDLLGDMEISGAELPFGSINAKFAADSKVIFEKKEK